MICNTCLAFSGRECLKCRLPKNHPALSTIECMHILSFKKDKDFYVECKLHGKCKAGACFSCPDRKKAFDYSSSAWGIGDAAWTAYVLAGIKKENPDAIVRFYSRRSDWLECLKGIEVYPFEKGDENNAKNLDINYRYRMTGLLSFKDFFARETKIAPAQPEIKEDYFLKNTIGDYVVLGPFSAERSREWPLGHWLNLEKALGLPSVILGARGDHYRISPFAGAKYCGTSPKETLSLIYHARLVMGNDSGIAHWGGLLKKKTLAIIAHLSKEKLYSYTEVEAISSSRECVPCGWMRERGYREICGNFCQALEDITPKMVMEKLKELNWR